MKKYFSNFILTLTCMFIFSFSEAPPGDYRDSYCGNYTCKCIFTHVNVDLTGLVYDTSTVTVVVQKNADDSVIDIITPIRTLNIKLRSEAYNNLQYKGKFYGDSLYLRWKPSHGPQTWTYFGKK